MAGGAVLASGSICPRYGYQNYSYRYRPYYYNRYSYGYGPRWKYRYRDYD
jgi:hypothetical protein